jgi:hypothetical protein
MEPRLSAVAVTVVALVLVVFGACHRESIEDRIDKLPTLPASVADTLDPKTHATRVSTSIPPPEKTSGPLLAPCCGSSDFKTLTVKFSYTKCAPLRDFIVVSLGEAVIFDASTSGPPSEGQPNVKVHRLGQRNARSVLDTTVCMTSDGPWTAAFREDRSCIGYTPQDTLLVTAFGDPVLFAWNGGTQNHPAGVSLVSCRELATSQYSCNPLSSCQCLSTSCPPDQPCSCTLQW